MALRDIFFGSRKPGFGERRSVAGTIDRFGMHSGNDACISYSFTVEGSRVIHDLTVPYLSSKTHVLGLVRKGDRILVTGTDRGDTLTTPDVSVTIDGIEHTLRAASLYMRDPAPAAIPDRVRA